MFDHSSFYCLNTIIKFHICFFPQTLFLLSSTSRSSSTLIFSLHILHFWTNFRWFETWHINTSYAHSTSKTLLYIVHCTTSLVLISRSEVCIIRKGSNRYELKFSMNLSSRICLRLQLSPAIKMYRSKVHLSSLICSIYMMIHFLKWTAATQHVVSMVNTTKVHIGSVSFYCFCSLEKREQILKFNASRASRLSILQMSPI